MDKEELYGRISRRKSKPEHLRPYDGGNGRIDRFLDEVRDGKLPRGGHVLDVGGSHGDLVELSVREGLFDMGDVFDISSEACYVARQRGLIAWNGDIDKTGLRTEAGDLGNYDAIVALDVIEHIVDPEGFARECYRALKPSGYVFINTPNISYWRHLESLVCDGRFPHTSGDREVYHGGHLAFYNENDLRDIFRAAGFKGLDWVHTDYHADPPPPIWMNLMRDKTVKASVMLSNPNLLFSVFKEKS